MRRFEEFNVIMKKQNILLNGDEYIVFEEPHEARARIDDKIIKPMMESNNQEWCDIDSLIGEFADAIETEGFINGFKAATRLLREAALI